LQPSTSIFPRTPIHISCQPLYGLEKQVLYGLQDPDEIQWFPEVTLLINRFFLRNLFKRVIILKRSLMIYKASALQYRTFFSLT
uniref:Ovule protein n=1 Tax=Haemonchus placei TaxID=6290 RepID=A0A0N4WDQ6_HAEPC